MRGHFFFMITATIIVLALHFLIVTVVVSLKLFKGGSIPQMLKFPHIEIKMIFLFTVGMLDVGLGVFANPKTSIGWKVY